MSVDAAKALNRDASVHQWCEPLLLHPLVVTPIQRPDAMDQVPSHFAPCPDDDNGVLLSVALFVQKTLVLACVDVRPLRDILVTNTLVR